MNKKTFLQLWLDSSKPTRVPIADPDEELQPVHGGPLTQAGFEVVTACKLRFFFANLAFGGSAEHGQLVSMSKLVTTDVAHSNAFQRKRALRKPASTHNTSRANDRVGAGVRVLRVLVVAAEQGSANGFLRQVRYARHRAHSAPDGLAGLQVATAWHPDVVLLDMEMPLMDGCQVAKHLRSDCLNEDCFIIAFAQRVDDASREPCLEAGIDLLLGKPVDRDVVETLLMLECARVNRSLARGRTPTDVDGPSTYPHSQ